ncbi:hypothetical protein BN1232_03186 [Mycobacterium rhizamassiliense]|uniref:Transmembrane protein n=1 Tax=Mycobacterium rhizamassiliense TaxID=1841860 RepID=A0A2U3NYB9_9MYCO|nr:hypothetical protein [Mycobacterium rhizamassiliense]SPM36494.1 hypothetical protein BN1232_03186 [Mycobacterium rhizamassiliense]
MTTAIAAQDLVEIDAADAHDDVLLAVAKVNAKACLGDTDVVENPRSRLTEEELIRASSITVIFVALMTVICVATAAILTMG